MKAARSGRHTFGAVLALVLCAGLVMSLASPAQAGRFRHTKSNTDSYSHRGYVKFPELGMCVKWAVKGTFTYTSVREYDSTISKNRFWLEKIKQPKPKLAIQGYKYKSKKCTSTKVSWKKLDLSHSWSGYSCSFHPTITVSFPWGFSVSAWPSCDSHKVAKRVSHYDAGDNRTQYSTKITLKYPEYDVGTRVRTGAYPKSGPCYASVINMTVYKGTKDDVNTSGRVKSCLTPSYNSSGRG